MHSDKTEQAKRLRKRQIHKHLVYHIIKTIRGEGTFIIDGKPKQVSEGSVLFISPGQAHCLGVYEDQELIYGEITFEFLDDNNNQLPLDFNEVFRILCGKNLSVPVIIENADENLSSLVQAHLEQIADINTADEKESFFHMLTSSSVYNLLVKLTPLFIGNELTQRQLSPLQNIHAYITENYSQSITLRDLSRIGGLSEKYISRRFKDIYGQTPIFYRDNLRIKLACELLRSLHFSVSQVAEKCGFADIYYFSKLFKKRKQISPGEFKKRAAAETDMN